MKYFFALIVLMVAAAIAEAQSGNTIYCYYGAWAKWRQGDGKYTIQNINPKLCTHIVYAFIGLNADASVNPLDSTSDYPDFMALKQINPNVKLIISMGGWNMGSTTFSQVTNDDGLRATMVNNIYNYVTSNGFDGFDIDWEYPAQRGGAASDKQSYVNFLRDLRAKFAGTGLTISAAVGAAIQDDAESYDVPNMNKYLDFFNIMTYDYHASWSGSTGSNSPLYGSGILNIDASVNGWLQAGATPSKVLIGLAFYGHSFLLANPSQNGIGAPIAGAAGPGPYSQQSGTLEYDEICLDLNRGGWTTVFDQTEQVPYSYQTSGNEWISYDNQQSLGIKVNYAKQHNLGGVLIWALEGDDGHNACGQGTNPLLTAVYSTMTGSSPPPSTSVIPVPATSAPATSAPATSAPATQAPSTSANVGTTCTAPGYFRSATSCSSFFECVSNGNGGYLQYPFNCPQGLVFDTQTSQCNYPSQVNC